MKQAQAITQQNIENGEKVAPVYDALFPRTRILNDDGSYTNSARPYHGLGFVEGYLGKPEAKDESSIILSDLPVQTRAEYHDGFSDGRKAKVGQK